MPGTEAIVRLMVRNSRAIAQAETRRLLKRRGREMLLQHGYGPASVAAIAAEAGFTTGAFYSNFASKADLALEVLTDLQDEAREQLAVIFSREEPMTERLGRLREWGETTLNSGWARLELEFSLANRRDPDIVSVERARNRTATEGVADLLTQVVPAPLAGLPSHKLAELVLDLVFGLAVRKVIDPAVSTKHLFDLLAHVTGDTPPDARAES